MRHLRKPGDEYPVSLYVWPGGAIWDPSRKPGVNMMIWSPGHGYYRLDEAGVVHLTWQPKYGPQEHHSGPGWTAPTRSRWVHWVVALYMALLIIGFAVGYALSHGSAADRLNFGAVGLLCTIVLSMFGTCLIRAFHTLRRRTAAEAVQTERGR